jgi:hypothetical protein
MRIILVFAVLVNAAASLILVPPASGRSADVDGAAAVPRFGAASPAAEPSGGRLFPQDHPLPAWRFASSGSVPQEGAPGPAGEQETGARGGFGEWVHDSFIDGASITLGYGVRRSSFTFTRKSDNASGTIVDRDYPAYFLIYSTKPSFFGDSRFGYTFMLKLATFDMNQQVASGAPIGGTPTDVRTDLEGIIGYAVPALYYQWGEHRATGTFFLVGAGLGLATTTYSGTVELSSATTSEQVNVRDQSFSLHLAWTVFLEARWRHWGGYLSVMRARLPGDIYDTRFEDASLYLGYRFFF